jgi:hypothetical protein
LYQTVEKVQENICSLVANLLFFLYSILWYIFLQAFSRFSADLFYISVKGGAPPADKQGNTIQKGATDESPPLS